MVLIYGGCYKILNMPRKYTQPKLEKGTPRIKKFTEEDLMAIYHKKSWPYKVKILEQALKEALLGQREPAIQFLANAMDYEYAEGEDKTTKWIKKLK